MGAGLPNAVPAMVYSPFQLIFCQIEEKIQGYGTVPFLSGKGGNFFLGTCCLSSKTSSLLSYQPCEAGGSDWL